MTMLLSVRNLQVRFRTYAGVVHALRGVDFDLAAGDIVGIVGESGCGKTVTASAIMRIIPSPPGEIIAGEAWFDGRDLLKMTEPELRHIRGNLISMIFQDPMTSLNPVLTIGTQLTEPFRLHQSIPAAEARQRAVELLTLVGISDPASRLDQYPHQLSGGMRQRVMIAMALACRPALLLADEPTTALDATIQGQILRLLAARCRERRMAVLLITHDLGVAAQMADTVGVMYAGRLVECAPAQELFADPRHPYTQGLLHAAPSARSRGLERLPTIPGSVPSLGNMPGGCPFHPRCKSALARCAAEMPPTVASGAHSTACWLTSQP